MTDISIDAADGSGSFSAYAATPATGTGPGILVIQEIFGVNSFIRETCDRFAAMGFLAVAPDLFWRLQPGIQLDAKIPEQFQQGLQLMGQFDTGKAVEDMKSTLEVIRNHHACTGKVGTIGYCLGGKLAYMMATRSDSDANVGYYGVGIQDMLGESAGIHAPLVLHIAEKDGFVPKEAQDKIVSGLSGNPHVTTYVYPGVDHAFARDGGDHYDAKAATLANERTMKMLSEALAPE
jgi:carboxymethylenebutenolidase